MSVQGFARAPNKFVQRLRRLLELPRRYGEGEFDDDGDFNIGGDFNVDRVVVAIEGVVDLTEEINGFMVDYIPREDRRLRERMKAMGHPLYDVPEAPLIGKHWDTDDQRQKRYELVAALMVNSGFPPRLLDNESGRYRFTTHETTEFFRARGVRHLNEDSISGWARRLLCFYREITNVSVPGRELLDRFAMGVAGMTTERLLRQAYGGDPLP